MKKFGKTVIASYERTIDDETFIVYVTEDKEKNKKEKYYDVHLLCDKFQNDESNTLKQQIPYSAVQDATLYFDTAFLVGELMEHYIWDRFYDEGVLSLSVTVHAIEKHDACVA